MKKLMRKCKRAFVLVLSMALVCNSLNLSTLNVYAENIVQMEQELPEEINVTVSDNETSAEDEMVDVTVTDGDSDVNIPEGGILELEDYKGIFILPPTETSAISMSMFSLRNGVVDKISGNAVNWYDRLDLSGDEYQFARDFYANLVEWSDNDSTEDYLIDDAYFASGRNAQKVATLSLTGTDMYETAMDVAAQLELYVPFMRAAYDAFDRDYPEVFWLSGTMAYDYGDGFSVDYVDGGYRCTASLYLVIKDNMDFSDGTNVDYDMRNPAYQSQSALDAAIVSRDAAIAQILTTEVRNMEPAKQIEVFNDVLTKSNQYNTIVGNGVAGEAPLDAWECISALTGRIGTDGPVCEGYARALKVLCDEVNIPCVLVDGYAVSGGSAGAHMWNYVQLDGNWYAIDVTWNDPVFSSDSVAVSGGEGKIWSLLGSDTVVNGMKFIDSHPVSNTASPGGVAFTNGPVLSSEKYSNNVAMVRSSLGVEVPYEDIKEALDAADATGDSTLILFKNVVLSDGYAVNGTFTLDLNGYTMDMGNGTLNISEGAALYVKDSSEGASGKITTSAVETLSNNGFLSLLGGTIENTAEGEGIGLCNYAVATIEGGTLTAIGQSSVGIFLANGGTCEMKGAPVVDGTRVDFAIDYTAQIHIVGAMNGEDTYSLDYHADSNGYYGNFAVAVDSTLASAAKSKFVSIDDCLEVVEYNDALTLEYLKGDIEVSILWDDEENRYDTRPEEIQIEVFANDELVDIINLEASASWEYILENMPLFNANGRITYDMILRDISGKYIAGYGPSEDGYVLIASLKHKHVLQLIHYDLDGTELHHMVQIVCAEEDESCDWIKGLYFVTVNEPAEDPLLYNGQAKQAEVFDNMTSGIPYATISELAYYKKNGNQWVAVAEAVDAGDYKAEVIVSLNDSTKAAWVEFEILKQPDNSFVYVNPYAGTFDPFAQDGVEAVEVQLLQGVQDAVIEYSTDGGSTWSTTVPIMKNAGSLEVKVRVSVPNYETYEESFTANMEPYDISAGYLEYDKEQYYYNGEAIEPLVKGVYNSMAERLPMTPADYTVTYANNVEVGRGIISLIPTNANYRGEIVRGFEISYFNSPLNILYNGSVTYESWYNDELIISADGYTIKRVGDTDFAASISLSEEGLWMRVPVQFKQNGTGYITDEIEILVSIDRTAPSFMAEDGGIYLNEHSWQTLATRITYDVIYEEDDLLEFAAIDNLPVYVEAYYYADTTGSNTALTKAQLDELRNAGKFVLAENSETTLDNDGKYVIYAYAVDEAGNISDYVSTNGIIKDTEAPEVVLVEPTKEAGTLKDTEMTFTVTADEDAMIGIFMLSDYSGESVDFWVYNDDYGYWETIEADEQITIHDGGDEITYKVFADAGVTKTITITGLRPNTFYEYSVEVYDNAENGTVCAGAEVENEPGAYYMKGITTLKTNPVFATNPTITGTYGQKLSEMTLSQPASTNGVPGSWNIVYADDSQKNHILNVGTTNSYQVKFTPSGENAEWYESVTVQVVPVVEKKAVTARIENVSITYGDDIPEFSCVADGILQGDAVTIILSTTAVKGSDAGTYTITGTCESANYDVTIVNGTLTIKQAQGTITVTSGKDVYNKTYGDDSFTLSGITINNSEGQMSFAVSGDAVSVDAAGKVTIKGAGNAVITVSMPETKNYKAAEAVEITVNVAKAAATDVEISKDYLYLREVQESIELSGYVAADAGDVTYTVGAVTGDCEFAVAPAVVNGKLTYTLKAGEVGDNATFTVSVSTDNYETFDISVTLKLVDKTPIEGEVSLKEDTLTYGEALSKLEFEETVFVAEGTGEEVTGTLSWVNPDNKPDVATTKATWVFTPDSNEYMEVTGEVTIRVNKANQPALYIVDLGQLEFTPDDTLKTAITTTGGVQGGVVTFSVPSENGVIRLVEEKYFQILGVGDVTITAVCADPNGNYEDISATYELKIVPCGLDEAQIKWAPGVTGEETYNGTAKEPAVVVYVEDELLREGIDYTVEYMNHKDAYILQNTDEGFDARKAPVVVVTGKGNYTGTLEKYFIIHKAQGTLSVASGKDVYNKTFGEEGFTLSGITTNNSEGQMSFAVSGDAISVDATGKVTIKGAGDAVITVSMPETKNYKAAEAVEITVNVAKASTTDQTVEKSYLYLREASESIDLSSYVAADAGSVNYTVGAVTGECEFAVAPAVVNGKLTYTLKAGEVGDNATFTVSVSTDNYETFDISVTLKLVDKTPIEVKEGHAVSLKENTLTYGEALSKLEFEETVFVAEGTDEEVTGTLSWKTPDTKPDVATTKAIWVFTPNSSEYMEVTGEVTIVVEKADYPEITIIVVNPTAYDEYGCLKVEGALADSQVIMTVPENNGVVKEIRATQSGFEIEALKVGTVTVTATAHDTTGNYKDGTATYELTVLPAELKAEWIGWAEGVNGEETYTGDALIPQVVVKKDAVILVQGEDYTVEYNNNTNAYEYAYGQEGFEISKAPVVTVIGKGNYEGEGSLYFVIKRAENAPNTPATEKTVANHVTKASQVSLPTDWIWQNPDQELSAEGANEVVAVYNGADKDNYVNITAIVSITRQEAGIPYVEEINGTEVEQIEAGWNHVKDDLQNAQEGDSIVVNMNGVTILPGDVLAQIKDKDITVVLDMGNDVEWHINGKSITAEEIPDVDLGVELNVSNIPIDIINTITGEIATMQISLAYSGEFGYEAILRIGLGAENADYYAQLFYFENEASLSYIQEDVIDAEGYAELPFVHASDYVIVIDDVAYQVPGSDSGNGSGSGGNGGSTPAPAPTPVPTPAPTPVVPQVPTSPNTGDTSAEPIVGMTVLFMLAALTLEYRRRKSNCR